MKQTACARQYQDTDLQQCRNLWQELVEHHREIYADVSIGGGEPGILFDEYLAKVGPGQIFVAVSNGSVVGLTGLEVKNNEADLEPIIVSRAWRQKGVGRMLVKKVVYEAQKRKLRYLNVMPVARNAQAIRFFHEMGFKNIGHTQLFMDFSGKKWKPSLKLHGCEFDY